jgi:hypothetical protein
MRMTPVTEHAPHIPRAMDAVRPWQAFDTPPTPTALDPRRWLGVVLAMLAGVAARMTRPRAGARGRAGRTGTP